MKEQIMDLVDAIGKMVDLNYRELNSAEIAFACEAVAQAHRELLFKHMRERYYGINGTSVDADDTPVAELPLLGRAYNVLRSEGISTIAQLERWSDDALLRLPNFGRKCLRDVRQALAEYHGRKAP